MKKQGTKKTYISTSDPTFVSLPDLMTTRPTPEQLAGFAGGSPEAIDSAIRDILRLEVEHIARELR